MVIYDYSYQSGVVDSLFEVKQSVYCFTLKVLFYLCSSTCLFFTVMLGALFLL